MTDGTVFVAVEIGCLECGNASRVIGVFPTHELARLAVDAVGADYDEPDGHPWGSYQARIFEVAPGSISEWQPPDAGRWVESDPVPVEPTPEEP